VKGRHGGRVCDDGPVNARRKQVEVISALGSVLMHNTPVYYPLLCIIHYPLSQFTMLRSSQTASHDVASSRFWPCLTATRHLYIVPRRVGAPQASLSFGKASSVFGDHSEGYTIAYLP
jgi:hypothetical protein